MLLGVFVGVHRRLQGGELLAKRRHHDGSPHHLQMLLDLCADRGDALVGELLVALVVAEAAGLPLESERVALMWRSYAALAPARLGQRDRADELIEEDLAIARRFGAPEPIGEALRVRALLAPSRDMVELAREAVNVLADSELRVAHARGLIDLGAALRRSSHRREARQPLRQGLDLANRCGSVIETDRAMHELRAAGARPRRPGLRDVDSLSAQERRVATMAAEGLSNREIAEALFLTRRTVEMHLTGAYRKLDVSGRGNLPATLATSR